MSKREIRNYAVAIIASIGVLSGLQLLVPNAQARPVQVYPTSGAGPMTLKGATCARWGTKINEDKGSVGFVIGGTAAKEAAAEVKADESKAMDDGCFIIY
jgi:hypothetical protein